MHDSRLMVYFCFILFISFYFLYLLIPYLFYILLSYIAITPGSQTVTSEVGTCSQWQELVTLLNLPLLLKKEHCGRAQPSPVGVWTDYTSTCADIAVCNHLNWCQDGTTHAQNPCQPYKFWTDQKSYSWLRYNPLGCTLECLLFQCEMQCSDVCELSLNARHPSTRSTGNVFLLKLLPSKKPKTLCGRQWWCSRRLLTVKGIRVVKEFVGQNTKSVSLAELYQGHSPGTVTHNI